MVVRAHTYANANNHLVLSYASMRITEVQFTGKLQNAVLKPHQFKCGKESRSGYPSLIGDLGNTWVGR